MRAYDCFQITQHPITQKTMYACDPAIDPARRTQKKRKRALLQASERSTTVSSAALDAHRDIQSRPSSRGGSERDVSDDLGAIAAPEASKQHLSGSRHDLTPDVSSKRPRVAQLELEVSDLYEVNLRRPRPTTYYCVKAGPVIVYRRRSDGMFLLSPVGPTIAESRSGFCVSLILDFVLSAPSAHFRKLTQTASRARHNPFRPSV